jgi:hypothetical protein
MESSILSEVHNASILRAGLSTDYAAISTSLASRIVTGRSACGPRSGLERSDFVRRRKPAVADRGPWTPQLGGDRSFPAPVETVWSHISGHSLFADRLDVTTMMS